MADKKPRRARRHGFMDGPDQLLKLNTIYRSEMFGNDRARSMARPAHAELDNVASPEPGEDLDDSEISDSERQQAIARERMRREGRA
jgi:hypothetical protein